MKEGVYEFGDAKAIVKQKIGWDQYSLWLVYKDCLVTMDDGCMVLEKMEDGVALDEDDAFMTWEGTQEISMSIFEIFNVLSIASGGARSADEAYERGKLEGENKILKQWNESLTGTTPPSTGEPSRPWSDDWNKVFPNPFQQKPLGTTPYITYNNNSTDATENKVLDQIDDTLEKYQEYADIRQVNTDFMKEYGKAMEERFLHNITGTTA